MHQIENSDFNQKCPTHKKNLIVLRLDSDKDPHIMKCFKCLQGSNFKSQILIEDLLESNETIIFKNWPFYHDQDEDNTVFQKLEQLSEWQLNSELEQVEKLFTDYYQKFVQKLQEIKKQIIKRIEERDQINQDCIQFYNQISQKEKLKQIIRYQSSGLQQKTQNSIDLNSNKEADEQINQNDIFISIIKENELNYSKNYEKLTTLIQKSSDQTFGLDQLQAKLDELLSQMNQIDLLDSLQEDKIFIKKVNDLYTSCQNFKKININFTQFLNYCFSFSLDSIHQFFRDLLKIIQHLFFFLVENQFQYPKQRYEA